MTDSGQSRRRELRFPIAMPVTASIGKRGVEGETRDVSYSGMFVAVDKLPPLRSFIRVHLDFPNDRGAVDLSGMVVRVIEPSPDNETESGIGIQLYANGDDVLNTWNAFISTIPTEVDEDVFEQTLTERNTSDTDGRFDAGIVLKNLSAEDLFRIYTLDIPRGLFFLSTENNLAIGDVILVDLIGKK